MFGEFEEDNMCRNIHTQFETHGREDSGSCGERLYVELSKESPKCFGGGYTVCFSTSNAGGLPLPYVKS